MAAAYILISSLRLSHLMTSRTGKCSRCAKCSFRFTQRHARAQAKLLPFPAKKTTAGMPTESFCHQRPTISHPSTGSHVPLPPSYRSVYLCLVRALIQNPSLGHCKPHGRRATATIASTDHAGVRNRTLRQMAMMNVGVIVCQPILQNKERKLPYSACR